MKEIMVHRSRLIATNTVDEGTVGIYAGLIGRSIKGIHRVIVADLHGLLEPWQDKSGEIWMGGRKRCHAKDFSHIILEGNHRAVAQAFFSEKIPSILLENDADLDECKRQSNEGTMCRFVHDETELDELRLQAFTSAFGHSGPESVLNVMQNNFYVDDWPKYIQKKLKLPK